MVGSLIEASVELSTVAEAVCVSIGAASVLSSPQEGLPEFVETSHFERII